MTASSEFSEEYDRPTVDSFDTYFVVGMKAGNPVVYLESEIPGMARDRVCSIRELRHIIDVVASDLHLQAIADTILATQNTQSSEEQVKARVEAAMAARMKESADKE